MLTTLPEREKPSIEIELALLRHVDPFADETCREPVLPWIGAEGWERPTSVIFNSGI